MADSSAAGYCDFIYSKDADDELFDNVLKSIYTDTAFTECYFRKVNMHSRFGQYLLKRYKPESEGICVAIPLAQDYESYYELLSKNARQNIRTAYNKLSKKSIKYTVDFYEKTSIAREMQHELFRIYHARVAVKNQQRQKIFADKIQDMFNPISRMLMKSSSNFLAALKLNGEVAGFLGGFFCSNGGIVVPRHAINNDFMEYNPGILLINEIIRYAIENLHISFLDLSRGDEKYKYAAGGIAHLNYTFKVRIR